MAAPVKNPVAAGGGRGETLMATYDPNAPSDPNPPMAPSGYTLGAGADLLNAQAGGGGAVGMGAPGPPPDLSNSPMPEGSYYPTPSSLPLDHPDHPDEHERTYQLWRDEIARRLHESATFDPN